MTPAAPTAFAHLRALAWAAGIITVLAVAGSVVGIQYERRTIVAITPLLAQGKETDPNTNLGLVERMKNQGIALQRRVFERPELFPLYGSSELLKNVPDKASAFFRNYPTGFSVVPIGKPGTTSLIMLQKIASVGRQVKGRRVALSLSPSWFFNLAAIEHQYEGNFSPQQALATLLNLRLSYGLRSEVARRLLDHPRTVQRDSLLHLLVVHLAGTGWSDRAIYLAAFPLAWWQLEIDAAQDHAETLLQLVLHRRDLQHEPVHLPQTLDWDRLIAEASALPNPGGEAALRGKQIPGEITSNAEFREVLAHSVEWRTFDLLVRGLEELHMRPLILCMPPNSHYYGHIGVSAESLALFPAKLHEMAEPHGAAVEAFEDHIDDTSFLADRHDHMSARGWMYYNKAIEEFYHRSDAALLERARGGHERR